MASSSSSGPRTTRGSTTSSSNIPPIPPPSTSEHLHFIKDIFQRHTEQWEHRFRSPLGLGVNRKVAILTCMDSSLHIERMLGLELGDAEVIRNAGGRVTMDVLRSLVVCQDLLDCHTVLVIHHTDCGDQEVARRHLEVKNKLWDHLMHAPHASWALRMASRVAYCGSMLVPPFMRQWAFKAVVHPIYGLEKELHDDLVALRRSSIINLDTALYGLIYFVHNGALKLVEKDEGSRGCGRRGGGKMKGQEMKEEEEEEEEEEEDDDEGPQ